MDSTAGEVQDAVLQRVASRVPELARFERLFKTRVRAVSCDRHGANWRVEKGRQTADPDLLCLVATCDAHKIAGAVKHTLKIVDAAVSGVIHTSLATSGGGSTAKLQAILQEIFAEELEIVYDSPPMHCVQHLEEVLSLFCPVNEHPAHSYKNAQRQYVLRRLCNSDISQQRIVHYCENGCCSSPERTKSWFFQQVTAALLPNRPPLLQRKSWTGADLSFQSIGLLQNFWGLLGKVVSRYTGRPQPQPGPADEGCAALQSGEADGVQEPDVSSEGKSWTAINQEYAKKANDFASGYIPPELFSAVLLVLQPAMQLLQGQLRVAGQEWQKMQEFEASQGRPRTFPAVEKARGSLLSSCLQRLFRVFGDAPPGFSLNSYVRRARSLLFRLLSALTSVLHFNMRRFERSFPWQLFTLLASTSDACVDALLELPECLRDPVAQRFFGLFPAPQEVRSREALAFLQMLACMIQTDISSVEASHASTRELCMARSRGRIPTIQSVAADTFFRFVRKRYDPAGAQDRESRRGPQGPGQAEQQEKKRKRQHRHRFQGAWRAFLHKRLQGRALTTSLIKEMSAEYQQLSFDEWTTFYELGCASRLTAAAPSSAIALHSAAHGMSSSELALSPLWGMSDYEDFLSLHAKQRQEATRQNKEAEKKMETALAERPLDKSVLELLQGAKGDGFSGAALLSNSGSGVRYHTWRPPVADFAKAAQRQWSQGLWSSE